MVAQFRRERDEAREQQIATAEILRVIRASPADVQPVFETIVRNAVSLCGGLFANVFRFDGELLHYVASHNVGPSYTDMIRIKYPMRPDRSQVSGRVVLAKSVVWLEDALTDPEYDQRFPVAMGWRRLLAVPMLREGKPIGVIGVGWAEPGPSSKVQEELLKTFADQAVIAIENTRLLNELRESLQQQTATADVLKVISSSPGELKPVFQAMLEQATRICDARFGIVFRYESGLFHPAAFLDVPPAYADFLSRQGSFPPKPGKLFGRLCDEKTIISILDRADEPDASPSARIGGARSSLAVPMLKDNDLVGALFIYRTEVVPFTDKQIELVKNFAAQAVIAIENTRLLNELRKRTDELTESLEQQTATSEVLKIISSSPSNLKPVFHSMLENSVRICEAKFGQMFLCEGDKVRAVATQDVPVALVQEDERRGAFQPSAEGGLARAIRTKKVLHIDDLMSEQPTLPVVKLGGARSYIAVPMLKESELVGVIVIYRQEVRPFTDKQVELVKNFAAQAVIAIENARLLSELRESLQQQMATADVLKVMSTSPGELEPVFKAMLANATRLCGAQFGTLNLRDGDIFRITAVHNVPTAFAKARLHEAIRPHPSGGHARVLSTKDVVQIEDIRSGQAYLDGDPAVVAVSDLGGARTIVLVPMLKDDVLVGTIAIYRQEVLPFTEKQIELVKNFAAQAVIAIENTRLLNELRESLQQQTATADVLKVISSSPGNLDPVFQAMLANAVHICDAKFGTLFRCDGDLFQFAAEVGTPAKLADFERRRGPFRPPAGTLVERVRRTKQVQHTADYSAEPVPGASARLGGARSAVCIPMQKDGVLVGVFLIYRQEVRPFTDKQIELLKNFAAQAVIAIENARLLSELRQRTDDLSESLEQQTATSEVLKVISSSPTNVQPVFDSIAESAVRLCNGQFSFVVRFDGKAMEFASYFGLSAEGLDAFRRLLPLPAGEDTAAGRALLRRAVVQVPDVEADPAYGTQARGLAKTAIYRSIVAVPLLHEGNPVGAIAVARAEAGFLSNRQIVLLRAFADQAVIAIENVRLFDEVQARTRELAKSLEDLRATQDRLVQTQKLASLGQLTAGIAHEIKNPLNFVNNFSVVSAELVDELQDALKDSNLAEKRRDEISELMDTLRGNLDKVVQHGKRADAIVKNMLLHSREGSGEHRPVDINALVEESLNLAYHGARAEKQGFNIALERSFDPAAEQADVFPQDITRVLLNLILNGFYATTKRKAEAGDGYEPTLMASTRGLGDCVEIRVRDNGTGIPPDVKEKIFNPFFTTKPAGEGTGLGLSISHDIIVKQHGGSIEVETEPGEYTEFRIILPRAAAFVTTSGAQS